MYKLNVKLLEYLKQLSLKQFKLWHVYYSILNTNIQRKCCAKILNFLKHSLSILLLVLLLLQSYVGIVKLVYEVKCRKCSKSTQYNVACLSIEVVFSRDQSFKIYHLLRQPISWNVHLIKKLTSFSIIKLNSRFSVFIQLQLKNDMQKGKRKKKRKKTEKYFRFLLLIFNYIMCNRVLFTWGDRKSVNDLN